MSKVVGDFDAAEEAPVVTLRFRSGEKTERGEFPLKVDVEYVEILRLVGLSKTISRLAEKMSAFEAEQLLSEGEDVDAGRVRTEKDEDRLRSLLREMTFAAVDAPREVLEQLTDMQRFRLTGLFTRLVTEGMRSDVDPTPAVGTTDSLGSDGSTAVQ